MTVLHQIDIFALQAGPVAIHWYGIMYLLGFGLAWALGLRRVRAGRLPGVNEPAYVDLLFYGMLGAVLGGLLGVLGAFAWWASRHRLRFAQLVDQFCGAGEITVADSASQKAASTVPTRRLQSRKKIDAKRSLAGEHA